MLEGRRLTAFALAATDVHIVHDPEQPGANAVGLEVERIPGAQRAEIRLLHEILRSSGLARQAPGDAVEQVELLQR
jgi:hypothetical protein